MTRWKQTKVDERSELASKFLDSLRSEAYIIAEDLGTDILFSNDNIPKVVEAVRERLFPLAEQESKELYRLGTQVGDVLSRQAGEPMVSYIDRRRRWLRKLQQLDKATHINEAVLTDLLLDNSGLSRNERLMVLTSMGSSVATRDAESALIKMHSRIHTLERRAVTVAKAEAIPLREAKAKVRVKDTEKGPKREPRTRTFPRLRISSRPIRTTLKKVRPTWPTRESKTTGCTTETRVTWAKSTTTPTWWPRQPTHP